MKRILWSIALLFLICVSFTACSKAENFYKNGKKSLLEGDYIKAAECFASAASINPDKADYYLDYGMALIKLGEYEQAISVFDRAYMNKDMSIIRQNDKKALAGKGISYYFLGQYESAVQEFEKALAIRELSELDMDILLYMSDAYQAMGLYEKAAHELTELLEQDDKNALLYARRAECYRMAGDRQKSLADYDSAISLEPGNYEYYFAKYSILEEAQGIVEARAWLGETGLLEKEPDGKKQEKDRYGKALVYFYLGDYDAALGLLEECLAEGDVEAAYYMAEISRSRKDYTNAIYYYEKYISAGGKDSSGACNQIAVSLMKKGAYEEALNYIERGLEQMEPFNERILRKNEIIAYEYLGRYEEADHKLKEYMKDYPAEYEAIREAVFVGSRAAGSKAAGSKGAAPDK